jgi:4-hydroxy-tetrahydrodipicolinate synthase
MFEGTFTALITPMRGGAIDKDALVKLVEHQIDAGITGLVPCGTTGETPALSADEQALVVKTVVETVKGRVPVVAGAGANDTKKAIAQSQAMAELGVDGLLHVTPYYNKPPQRALIAHFEAIAESSPLPIILYNVPGRTACDMLPETVAALTVHPKIAAIKEATGSVARAQHVIQKTADHDATVLSGDDATSLALVLMGGHGTISVLSNLAPAQTAKMIAHARAGELAKARELHYLLMPLMDLLFIEANPIPVKAAAAMLGFTQNEVRLPLLPLPEERQQPLRDAMKTLGLLS